MAINNERPLSSEEVKALFEEWRQDYAAAMERDSKQVIPLDQDQLNIGGNDKQNTRDGGRGRST